MWYRILRSVEYDEWFENERPKSQVQIEKRLSKIETEGHFGNHKSVAEHVWELKWENGRRVYYAYFADNKLLLLLGGNKNGQDKDIRQAERILEGYASS